MSPMQRSLAHLRAQGYEPAIVERRLPYGNVTQDFFGIGDVIALKSGERPILVQTTSGANFAARQDKILDCEHLPLLLEHFRIVLHGWSKHKLKRGGKAERWELREAEFTVRDLELREAADA